MHTYDDACWHYQGDYPADLPFERAATHIVMFVAWAVEAGLAATGTAARCEALTERELSEEGNAFARAYYKNYQADYEDALGGDVPTLYHVEATVENLEKLKRLLDARYADWRGVR